MSEDELLPTGLPRAVPPPRWRRSRRQSLLAAGLTGLVVTSASPSGASTTDAAAPYEVLADAEPDPAVLFGVDLSVLLPAESRQAPADHLVSGVVEGPSAIARWDGVEVHTDGDQTELVGFHESNDADALPLDSTRPIATSHHAAVSLPTTGEPDGQVVVLPTRQRASGPMTAIDVAVQPDAPVVAPVTGVVVESTPISYEGADHRILIRPDANPDVEVLVVHVVGAVVEPGDRVEAGTTPIATAPRQLHFDSQIDRFTEAARGAPAPHVHVELRAAAPTPA